MLGTDMCDHVRGVRVAYGEKQQANISRAHVGKSNGRLNGRQM